MAKLTHAFAVLTICTVASLMATGCFSCSAGSRTPPPTQIIIQAPPGSTATVVPAQ